MKHVQLAILKTKGQFTINGASNVLVQTELQKTMC